MIARLLLGLILFALAGALALAELQRRWQQPLNLPPEGYTLTVQRGDSLRSVTSALAADNILEQPLLLQAYGRYTGLDARIRRGEYRLQGRVTPRALLSLLVEGRVIQYQITLPEGITLTAALQRLQQEPLLVRELEGGDDPRLSALVAPREHGEGLFFPDTYQFEKGASDWDILRRAHAAMQDVLTAEWQGRAEGLPYDTPYEALVMASIIERETGLPEERAEIAGVFVRRLQRGMRLQTDPTVIYGLGAAFDGNLRRTHLRDPANPYNSYRHSGLPPTPIALPGREAIHAALHPASGDSLYFVARGDGGHVFSATLEEHEAAVRKYQLQRKKNYRSSPERS